MGNPIKDTIEDFEVISKNSDRPKCGRCGAEMLSIQACHFICPSCGGSRDCSDG